MTYCSVMQGRDGTGR